jgi:hypothetical protein
MSPWRRGHFPESANGPERDLGLRRQVVEQIRHHPFLGPRLDDGVSVLTAKPGPLGQKCEGLGLLNRCQLVAISKHRQADHDCVPVLPQALLRRSMPKLASIPATKPDTIAATRVGTLAHSSDPLGDAACGFSNTTRTGTTTTLVMSSGRHKLPGPWVASSPDDRP